jgi:FixJ family two-component response regulator
MDGPELQCELISRNESFPIIFIMANSDDEVVSSVMADGAVDCLLKPFSEETLLIAIDRAFAAN